jgi:hypothetical protein
MALKIEEVKSIKIKKLGNNKERRQKVDNKKKRNYVVANKMTKNFNHNISYVD